MNTNAPTPATKTTNPRKKANRTFIAMMIVGFVIYALGLLGAGYLPNAGISPWWGVLLFLPGIGLMAWTQVGMYRSGDEFERAKIAEAVLLAFLISTPLIFAVGVLQIYVLPEINWMAAFTILMVSWILGTIVSAIRYR